MLDEPLAAGRFDPIEGRSVSRSATLSMMAQCAKLFAQLGSVLVLSRLLSPLDFGVVAMAAPLVAFVALLQDFGLSQALIQRRVLSHEQVSGLFWVSVFAGSVAATAVLLLAPSVGAFYADPRVSSLTQAMALPIVLGALTSVHGAILARQMRFGALAIVEVCGAFASLGVAVIWALSAPSYWALFAGASAGALVVFAGAWLFAAWSPSLPQFSHLDRALLGFGGGVTGFAVANFFARNADNVLVGKVWGGIELGLYDRAYKLMLFPLTQLVNPIGRVMVPALSRLLDSPEAYGNLSRNVQVLMLVACAPGMAWAALNAEQLVTWLLGPQWAASAPVFAALAWAGLVQPLNSPAGWLLVSQARTGEFMWWGIGSSSVTVLAFVLGLDGGALGVATFYAISEWLKTPVLWWLVAKKGPIKVGSVALSTAPPLAGAMLALGLIWFSGLQATTPVLLLLPASLIGIYVVAIAAAIASRSSREALMFALERARGMVRRRFNIIEEAAS